MADGVRARLWDAPVRVVHWAIVGLVGFCWWSADTHLQWHAWAGYALLGLLIFRVWWGFAGGEAARFSSFVRGPAATFAYLRTLASRAPSETPGHNPLGALSVVALLLTLVVQVVTGLFSLDIDGLDSGPLSDRVSFELGTKLTEWHDLSFRVLQGLVILHLAAIAYYLVWKRTNLIGPMITGRRVFASDPGLGRAPLWRLIAGAVLAFALMAWIAKGMRF